MSKHHTVSEVFRKDMRARLDNPYRRRQKYPSNTKCPVCGLLFRDGVWRWEKAEASRPVKLKPCPACLQIRDDYPAGVIHLKGAFVAQHRREILNRVRNVEMMVLDEHPLERIYRMEDDEDGITLYSTGDHLAARIGKALRSDFSGRLQTTYASDEHRATVCWTREQ